MCYLLSHCRYSVHYHHLVASLPRPVIFLSYLIPAREKVWWILDSWVWLKLDVVVSIVVGGDGGGGGGCGGGCGRGKGRGGRGRAGRRSSGGGDGGVIGGRRGCGGGGYGRGSSMGGIGDANGGCNGRGGGSCGVYRNLISIHPQAKQP